MPYTDLWPLHAQVPKCIYNTNTHTHTHAHRSMHAHKILKLKTIKVFQEDLERWFSGQEHLLFFLKTKNPSLVPNTHTGGSKPPVTLASGDQMPSSGLSRYLHICGINTHTRE